jgi:small-conductance mechanosensitive channel
MLVGNNDLLMLKSIEQLLREFNDPTQNTIFFAASIVLGVGLRYLFYLILRIYILRTDQAGAHIIQKQMKGALFFVLPVFFMLYFFPLLELPAKQEFFIQRTLQIFFILSFSWVLIRATYVTQAIIFHKYHIDKDDNLLERKVQTQIQFIRRITILIIVIVATSLVLMRFEGMRKLGAGLITSAGILGVIVGFAAQKSLGNLLAGLQIAFTQPIRIDDVVIVEGEWGKIEEIHLTYVVVKIWDLRRMVLPITYFIEKPFQNWTRNTADILGHLKIFVDYSIPVANLRQKLMEITQNSPLWDGDICILQVTDFTEKTMELRCLVSARNSGDAFDLRCFIREEMITYIQQNFPQGLPKLRTELAHALSHKE